MRLHTLVVFSAVVFGAPHPMAAQDPAEPERAALRDARLEALPPARAGAGYRLRATLEPVPAPLAKSAGAYSLTATLAPDVATAALCPVPGWIFSDSFESP